MVHLYEALSAFLIASSQGLRLATRILYVKGGKLPWVRAFPPSPSVVWFEILLRETCFLSFLKTTHHSTLWLLCTYE